MNAEPLRQDAGQEDRKDLESRVRISELLSLYGELLPDKQRTAVALYYDEDLSHSEIAEANGTSRQAAYDAVRSGRNSLENYDQVLGLLARRTSDLSAQTLEPSLALLGRIRERVTDNGVRDQLAELESMLLRLGRDGDRPSAPGSAAPRD